MGTSTPLLVAIRLQEPPPPLLLCYSFSTSRARPHPKNRPKGTTSDAFIDLTPPPPPCRFLLLKYTRYDPPPPLTPSNETAHRSKNSYETEPEPQQNRPTTGGTGNGNGKGRLSRVDNPPENGRPPPAGPAARPDGGVHLRQRPGGQDRGRRGGGILLLRRPPVFVFVFLLLVLDGAGCGWGSRGVPRSRPAGHKSPPGLQKVSR